MNRILISILIITSILSCGSQSCENINEIGFVYNIRGENSQQSICQAYESNRGLFFTFKNESEDLGINQIEEILAKSKVSKSAIDEFVRLWQMNTREHRQQTQQRDSIYRDGLTCLKKVLKDKQRELKDFVEVHKERIESSLTKSQIKAIQKGIYNYRKFNQTKKDEFLKEQTLQYGKLGSNIIEYNQLSFEVIDTFITSQYSFGLPDKYSNELNDMYNSDSILKDVYKKYRELEDRIVKEITSDECQKRIGVLRYYDGLNEENKEKAIKTNMLMNTFK